MNAMSPGYDVFLSHAIGAVKTASAVRERFEEAGLSVFDVWRSVAAGEPLADNIWEALAESAAVVAVLTPDTGDNPNLAFEVGAARAWQKPVYLLIEGPHSYSPAPYLREIAAYPMSRLAEVIHLVANATKPLSDDERATLADVYANLGLSVDEVLTRPGAMDRLAGEYAKVSRSRVPGEKLARELLRLRKSGRLGLATAITF